MDDGDFSDLSIITPSHAKTHPRPSSIAQDHVSIASSASGDPNFKALNRMLQAYVRRWKPDGSVTYMWRCEQHSDEATDQDAGFFLITADGIYGTSLLAEIQDEMEAIKEVRLYGNQIEKFRLPRPWPSKEKTDES